MARTEAAALPRARPIAEIAQPIDGVPIWTHADWRERFPWLVQGITGAGSSGPPFDLALFGQGRPGDVLDRWWALGRAAGATRIVHGHQVHGAVVRVHDDGSPGLHVAPATDGHVTRTPGVLLAVSVADCVPVAVVDPGTRAVALLHAGWRGVAAGILERGLQVLAERMQVPAEDVHVHLGPAICGRCYEVGPEVHRGLGLTEPATPEAVDLRAVLADRALAAGVRGDRLSASTLCTRCGDAPFFSHRGGRPERQIAFLGVAPR
jgi:YfiH family protein